MNKPSYCNHEDFPCCGCAGSDEQSQEAALMREADEMERGWPGSGDGSDDLADTHTKEADDYYGEDAGLDSAFEDRCDDGDFGGED